MLRKSLISLMITVAVSVGARPQTSPGRGTSSLQAAGERIADFPLPNPGSGPTTISIAPDGTLWFTESTGNRIGRMAPDGSNLKEFDLPHAGSAPRIITIGSDGNFWFSEHLGNRMGRITPGGAIGLTADSDRAPVGRLVDKLWFAQSAGNKISFLSFR